MWAIDQRAWERGYVLVGVDECGRGALAGPCSAGAVLLYDDPKIPDIRDSKKIAPRKRERVADEIKRKCLWGVAHVSHDKIDEIGIRSAVFEAMRQAVRFVVHQWRFKKNSIDRLWVLVDGPDKIPSLEFNQKPVVCGDDRSMTIAAASIVGKVERDQLMVNYHDTFPNYEFSLHKGYGTKIHKEAIEKHGPCEIHRQSVKTVRKKVLLEEWEKARKRGAPWDELQLLGRYFDSRGRQ